MGVRDHVNVMNDRPQSGNAFHRMLPGREGTDIYRRIRKRVKVLD